MSADNGISISRKKLKAWHWQAQFNPSDKPIATGKNLDDLINKIQKWRKKREKEDGWFEIEYGINFID